MEPFVAGILSVTSFVGAAPLAIVVLGGSLWLSGLVVLSVGADCAAVRFLAHAALHSERLCRRVEKLWSAAGSVPEGRIIAPGSEAGYQAELLRGGIHFGYWRWQYSVHQVPPGDDRPGQIGYVYARDGEPLPSDQTLARVVSCNHFQDARSSSPPRTENRNRAANVVVSVPSCREGVYAINAAVFVVITESRVFAMRNLLDQQELQSVAKWREELLSLGGFEPVIIGRPIEVANPFDPECVDQVDSIGIVTVHDGPSLAPGEIIAPAVGTVAATNTITTTIRIPRRSCAPAVAAAASMCRSPTAPTSSTAGSPRSS